MTTVNKLQTTGIGSLPHHNADAALDFSFRMDLPFLPQIPIRNRWEYMIPQALEGLPGLDIDASGNALLDASAWESRTASFKRLLESAFEDSEQPTAFDRFELHASISGAWPGFVFELGERGVRRAKIQTVGPMTAQWALRLKEGGLAESLPGLSSQIYRLVLARAIASVRRLKSIGVSAVIYLDEPGLYGLSLSNPKHILGISELKIMIQTLNREGAQVGLHCCSNTDWDVVLDLADSGLGILSIDTRLSLANLFSSVHSKTRISRIMNFIDGGGILSLGIVPTTLPLHSLNAAQLVQDLQLTLDKGLPSQPKLIEKILTRALYTPACGLALHSVDDAEHMLGLLSEVRDLVSRRLAI